MSESKTTIVAMQADTQSIEWKAIGIAAKIASHKIDLFAGAEEIVHLFYEFLEKRDKPEPSI